MANSMIPYSFIPGTKAKANEVNANFVALANLIEQNKSLTAKDIKDLQDVIVNKAEKSELVTEFTVEEADTDLNDYLTKGTYIFTSLYLPSNAPSENAGMLIVTGDSSSVIKQMWFDDSSSTIFTRDYKNSTWSDWIAILGSFHLAQTGYIKLPNGLLIQWGGQTASGITYPIAYTTYACPLFSKNGYGGSYTRSDTGITADTLTGFGIGSAGVFVYMNWIAIGY